MLTEQEAIDAVTYLYGGPSEDMSNYSARLIKVRKEHMCSYNYYPRKELHHLKKGENAIIEKAIDPDNGWVSSYTCMDCLEYGFKELNNASTSR